MTWTWEGASALSAINARKIFMSRWSKALPQPAHIPSNVESRFSYLALSYSLPNRTRRADNTNPALGVFMNHARSRVGTSVPVLTLMAMVVGGAVAGLTSHNSFSAAGSSAAHTNIGAGVQAVQNLGSTNGAVRLASTGSGGAPLTSGCQQIGVHCTVVDNTSHAPWAS